MLVALDISAHPTYSSHRIGGEQARCPALRQEARHTRVNMTGSLAHECYRHYARMLFYSYAMHASIPLFAFTISIWSLQVHAPVYVVRIARKLPPYFWM